MTILYVAVEELFHFSWYYSFCA